VTKLGCIGSMYNKVMNCNILVVCERGGSSGSYSGPYRYIGL
jgi:hypothetical protein